MPADVLSEILRLATVETMVTGGFDASAPWALRFPAPNSIKFFALTKGACWARIDGEPPLRFEQGDVGLLTARRSYTVSSDPSVAPLDAMELFSGRGRSFVTLGDGQDCSYVGGHILLDPTSGTLLSEALPPWLRIEGAREQAARFRWLLSELVSERKQRLPGGALVASQLAQLLFVQILRAQLGGGGRIPPGWLRALGDPRLAPAVELMHDEPARAWHLGELARACAMSRSTFAARYTAQAGIAPLGYLARWRMHLACRALRDEGLSVASVAALTGYASQGAFSTAFKRMTGLSPSLWRERHAGGDAD
ncbi:AraC family transcriptional regulator [Paroceanicella profunda]|uniref:AraC family transcriptional regulator n=1 Tax=Paroceanicella profunda TaxID=2579971 RepID=A0A5B8G0B4_9RHOB|nr:AraC family transcriptional regulator [Paroceanicella profunda]QDL92489.1 AraC family transcriptional regulator [Paroceanicella profunda]